MAHDKELTVANLKQVFDSCDPNHDGVVSRSDLLAACKKSPEVSKALHLPPPVGSDGAAKQFETPFQKMDKNKSKTVTWDEFKGFFAEHVSDASDQQLVAQEESAISRYSKQVLTPTVDSLEGISVKSLTLVERKSMDAVGFVAGKTEDLSIKAFGYDNAEKLKILGKDGLNIGNTTFHRMGGIADQFADLVEKTTMDLWNVAGQAGQIMTKGERGQKVREWYDKGVKTLEDATEAVPEIAGATAEEYFSGSRTKEERTQLLLESTKGKGEFGINLSVLAERGELPRVITMCCGLLKAKSDTPDLFKKPTDEAMVKEVEEQVKLLNEDSQYVLPPTTSPYLVVAILNEFFKELPQALLLERNFEGLCKAAKDPNPLSVMAPLFAQLPEAHKPVAVFMFQWTADMGSRYTTDIITKFAPVWLPKPDDDDVKETQEDCHAALATMIRELKRLLALAQEEEVKMNEGKLLQGALNLARAGNSLFVQAKYPEALAKWEEALRIRETVKGEHDKSLASLVANLSVCHSMMNNAREATRLNQRCAALMRG